MESTDISGFIVKYSNIVMRQGKKLKLGNIGMVEARKSRTGLG